ncbi:MAG: flagellar biosynthetic protein FliR [Rhodobacteraceae bacterium]|nr:flagellar biosynthetic protein FliR [Paracoccaceae bacterium]
MNELAEVLLPIWQPWLWAGWAVFLRVSAGLAFLPVFGEQSIPVRVRLALAGAFTFIVTPAVAAQLALPPPGFPGLVQLTATETLAGLVLGFSVRAMVWALHVAGSIAAQATSLSQLVGGANVDPQPAIAQILLVAGLALAAATGLHVHIARALIMSYDTLPAGRFPFAGDVSSLAVARVAGMFSVAFTYAAPFVVASLIYNLALGVINRAMPQLMVAFVGAPAITAGGLALLALTAPLLLQLWLHALQLRLALPFQVLP